MSKFLLLSIVFVPALLGMSAARSPRARQGLLRLLAAVVAFDLFYVAALLFIYSRWL